MPTTPENLNICVLEGDEEAESVRELTMHKHEMRPSLPSEWQALCVLRGDRAVCYDGKIVR